MPNPRLDTYRQMRDFTRTEEPFGIGAEIAASDHLRFVIHKHDASRLHFDLRLEWNGTFLSWAVPKGPSLDPADKRLAMAVEDHPLDYGDFEGPIPKDLYGGGTVMIWDRGLWIPEHGFEDVDKNLQKGELKFVMEGHRMHGSWVLVRLKPKAGEKGKPWMLIKHKDSAAKTGNKGGPSDRDKSIASIRTMKQIAANASGEIAPYMTLPRRSAKLEKSVPTLPRPNAKNSQPPDIPDFIEPQLAANISTPPAGNMWAHEIKFDGYRLQLRIDGEQKTLRTRKGLDWTKRFPSIVADAKGLQDGLYDGEAVALDDEGKPSFALLQAVMGGESDAPLIYYAFDLLHDGQQDIRSLPLADRKAKLEKRLAKAKGAIRYVEHFQTTGNALLQSACRLDLEGIISKHLNSPYRSGRSDDWVKSKCRQGQEVVIAGWATTGKNFRSLIAGVYREGRLEHVGRIGTGFSRKTVEQLMPELKAIETAKSPFPDSPKSIAGVHWVKPVLVAEIAFEGFTGSGSIRQASFKALREDKAPKEVALDNPQDTSKPSIGAEAPLRGVRLSSPDKVLWPATKDRLAITKRDLAEYYERVGEKMLEHIRGRPCSIIRMPDGIEGKSFFQRHPVKGQSPLIEAVEIKGDPKPYIRIDTVEGLIAAAQFAAVEIHPWNCVPYQHDKAERLIFDLDPAPDVGFEEVILAAKEVRARLKELGLESHCKTTGGKGLHVTTYVEHLDMDWTEAKGFAREFARVMAVNAPDRYLISMSKEARKGRIFIDYLRNDRKATAVAPYSPRGRPGAPVSMPLSWSQVRNGLDPCRYRIEPIR
ncbi:DNA ligase D [Brevundimonas terrae]|uniref:DNA ligase (ATP) n=1 Tax=Brevundimonas terrae TaxID=363631 RepID=A0ABN0YJN0_9CAUL|nr:DNA ligase D [Brevundimonas terrae]NIJ27480.1 bifunctional non-homologous end joining protein LigD [Brevundimonas terrae]